MPDVRINIGKIQSSKTESIRQNHTKTLNDLKDLTSSLKKIQKVVESDGCKIDKEIISVLLKKFLFTISTVNDDYFLTDVCELSHELFIEFRLILGYIESQKPKKLKTAMKDVLDMCVEATGMFREFLSNPGYNGTNFPKPKKLRAMRDLGRLVVDAKDVVVLTKDATEKKLKSNDIYRDRFLEQNQDEQSQVQAGYPEVDYNQENEEEHHVSIDISMLNTQKSTDSESSTSSCETPLTPKLYSEEISSMRAAVTRGSGNVLVSAMGELMPPPPPPASRHGKISYVQVNRTRFNDAPPIPSRRASRGMLRPPILIDDDGDILPNTGPAIPQMRSASVSIYESSDGRIVVDEPLVLIDQLFGVDTPKGLTPRTKQPKVLDDDDSFIMAYREHVLDEGYDQHLTYMDDRKNPAPIDFGSSGWSLKNRI